MGFFSKLFGNLNEREIDKLRPIVEKANEFEDILVKLSDEDLKKQTKKFQDYLIKEFADSQYINLDEDAKNKADIKILDKILPEAFATVREASKRVLNQRHYDVQLIGGIVLHRGKIAEMKTGEGKTLVASLPLYLNALTGRGCHLVTTNDYLARVGGGWMGPIYGFLGLKTAVIAHDFSAIYDSNYTDPIDHGDPRLNHWRPVSRKEAYAADIVYGTNNEFGFDYLRDNMAYNSTQLAQRPFNYAIVDEVDSILIDEARTPLIISAPAEESASLYQKFAQLVPTLNQGEDYNIEEKERTVDITSNGIKKMEKLLGVENLYDTKGIKLVHHLEEALKAHYLFKKDKDYVVKDGEIVIVDEFTGRLMTGRRYSGGLHQAIEAKENVEVKRESDTLATITFQNLFRMYPKLSGMTGTASTEAEEFAKIYNLDVLEIPTHRSVSRIDKEDEIYKSESAKYKAIIRDIEAKVKKGQPVLIGTISIQKNEQLSKLLKRNGIKHNVLNAKNHEKEAKIIAQAGKPGVVTLATNMAGRGVDIVLGGEAPKDKKELIQWEKDHQIVLEAGGLAVIGTERHESRRIDNQLRGRAGRQGDPGESKFYVSMQDDLMRIFGGERIISIMDRLGLPEDEPVTHKMITNSIEQAQRKVEGHNFDIRKHLVEYDDVMNKHREVIYRKRKKILNIDIQKDTWLHEELLSMLSDDEIVQFKEKISNLDEPTVRHIEKTIYLRTIDVLWIEHLNTMTELREGIGLRGYGQRDPLIEYKQEAYAVFQNLINKIESQVLEMLLKVQIQKPNEDQNNRRLNLSGANENLSSGAISNVAKTENSFGNSNNSDVSVRVRTNQDEGPKTVTRKFDKVGRNDPCPCGSGKKYKKCCGK